MRRPTSTHLIRTAVATAALLAAALAPTPASADPAPAANPAGGEDTQPPAEIAGWSNQQLAPGVDVRSAVVGHQSDQHWTVTVRIPGGPVGNSDPDAPKTDLADEQHANALADALRAHGFQPRVERVEWPDYADTPHGALGWRVRVGDFAGKQQATDEAARIHAAGFTTVADWTGFDGGQDSGPYRIKVAVIDPRHFSGQTTATHGPAASGRETTSQLSTQAGALVGVNAGFFVIDAKDGIPGKAAGIGVYQGKLESEATNGRAALVLGDGGKRSSVQSLSTDLTVHSGPNSRPVEGVNRKPGIIRDCGEPGDAPTSHPLHDVTCTKADELVLLTPELGAQPPSGPGVEAVLNAQHQVTALRPRGGPIPADGSVLQGIGTGADWLTANARPGRPLRVDEQVRNAEGQDLHFGPNDAVVNGGPWLVRDGKADINADANGIAHPGDPSFLYAWALKRNPRTMAGIDRFGRLLLVTVDGRQPGFSEGFSLSDGARFMQSIGAVNAMNLDGGGSTAMAINGALTTSPSDATGERPVGDAIVVVPRKN